MALYLGSSEKLMININELVYRFNLPYSEPTADKVIDNAILSSDNCVLVDANGYYITFKNAD